MSGKLKKTLLLICTLTLTMFAGDLFAANTGKIAGKVVDKQTGEPLIGANVLVQGTDLGAATGEDGSFTILQVPPGEYTVQVRYIGYQQLNMTNVNVRADLTTRLTLELQPQAVEAEESVTVTAERKMVQQDITATRRSVSEADIEATPGVESVQDILRAQSGMVAQRRAEQISLGEGVQLEVRDPSLTGLNIRGSRGGDALILIDGIPASHPMYGGFDVMDLNKEDIKNIEIITGAFSAEYGQATSAIINITTRSGGKDFRGTVSYRTDEMGILGDSYGKQRMALNLSGPEPLSSNLLPNIGLKIPGNLNFFTTLTVNRTNTEYNNHRTRDPLLYFSPGDLGLGANRMLLLNERQENEGQANFKLNYNIGNFKWVASYRGSFNRWTEHDWSWKNYPDHMSEYSRDTHQYQFRLDHTLSGRTYYTLNFGATTVNYQKSHNQRSPTDFWIITEDTMYSSIEQPHENPITGFYDARGFESSWVKNSNTQYSLKFDFTSQAFPSHLIKTGFDVSLKDLNNIHINSAGVALSEYGRHVYRDGPEYPPPPGPYKEFGRRRWVIDGLSKSGSVYLTDKFERESLIINAGVRADWLMPGPPTTEEDWKEQWERATGLNADWPRIHFNVDPRLGVSFPISTETVIYFSYGHFNDIPGLDQYLRDPYSGGFTGNPHLNFVQTVKYEFGFTHEFPHSWALDIKNYTKENSGETGTTSIRAEYGLPIELHDNKGYSRARGLEFELRKRTEEYLNGNVTYTLQWANGYSSSIFDDYRRSQNNLPNPIRARRLDWDIRHQIVGRGSFLVRPGQEPPTLFGWKMPRDWKVSFLTQINSGRPYTPGTNDPVKAQKLKNTQTMPPTYRTDIRIEKGFTFGGYHLNIGLDIDNVFDQYNVTGEGFNEWTGEPYQYGDPIENTNQYYDYFDVLHALTPGRFGEGRHVEMIFEVKF